MSLNSENKSKSTIFYIVRHGQSEANVKSKMGVPTHPSSWHETDLSEVGIKQVEDLSTQLEDTHFDVIFSSDAKRAVKTAEILVGKRELPVNLTDRLRETSAGETAQVFLDLTSEQKMAFFLDANNETYSEAATRFATFMHELAAQYAGLAILIVSHGTLIKALLIYTSFATLSELPSGSVENASYIVAEVDGTTIAVKETHRVHKRKPVDSSSS